MEKKHSTFTIDLDLAKRLKVYCAMTDKKQSRVVETLIREYLDNFDKGAGVVDGR